MTETPRSGRSGRMIAAAVLVGLIGSGGLVWQASSAAFTATTDNSGNSWTSGSVVLSDNDSGSALFAETNLVGGSTEAQCIEVEYDGNVASSVKLYATTPTGALAPYLDFDVELGSGVSCSVPGTWTKIFGDANTVPDVDPSEDTLDNFTISHTSWATGVGTWTPSAANTVRPYRFTYTLGNDAGAQGKSATGVNFIWEAQST